MVYSSRVTTTINKCDTVKSLLLNKTICIIWKCLRTVLYFEAFYYPAHFCSYAREVTLLTNVHDMQSRGTVCLMLQKFLYVWNSASESSESTNLL